MSDQAFSSGELGRMAGVSGATVRHYERRGLLDPAGRTRSGHRRYPGEALHRMKVIRAALAVGFSVEDLAGIFSEKGRGSAPCRRVRRIAGEKLRLLERQARDLGRLCKDLRETVRAWDRKLGATPADHRAGLLDDLARRAESARRRLSPLIAPGLRRHMDLEKVKEKKRCGEPGS